MFVFAAGWISAIGWLWVAGMQQHILRHGEPPANYAARTITFGVVPAILIALGGAAIAMWTGRAPHRHLERREWRQAFWWSLVPNWMLFTTVWVMIQESR